MYFCNVNLVNDNNEIYSYSLPLAGFDCEQHKLDGTGTKRFRILPAHRYQRTEPYSIASMYHVTVDDIVRLNPGSRDQIRAGEALKIPQVQTSNQSSSTFHTIQAGETLYQLTVKYNITAQAICDANPGLSARTSASGRYRLYRTGNCIV